MSIEARAQELMSMQKIELATLVAEYEAASTATSAEPATDPVITDVPPASTEPEILEPMPEQPAATPSAENAAVEGADAASTSVFDAASQAHAEANIARINELGELAATPAADSEGQLP